MSGASGEAISVVIPAYNAGRYLPRAVASALAQTDTGPLQVVIVDDCSSDDTREVMQALKTRHPDRITLGYNDRNAGPAATRNRAIALAEGDWIALLDADDAYRPERLARMIAAARTLDAEVVADLPIYYDLAAEAEEDDQPARPDGPYRLSVEDMLAEDRPGALDPGLLKPVFRAELAQRGLLQFPDIRHAEDFQLYLGLLRADVRFFLLDRAYYLFSTRFGAKSGQFSPGSVTRVNYRSVAEQSRDILEDMRAAGDLTPRIETLLTARIDKSMRQNRRYCWTLLRRGEWSRLAAWLREDTGNRTDMAAVLMQKLKGKRGLPD